MSTDGNGHHKVRDRRRDTRLVATGVVAVLLVWFALDNFQSVPIHFWLHTTMAPLVVVVAIAVGLGAAVVLLASRFTKKRQRNDE
ncbi:MAG: lipopolysaccharide assembly protein LapA domain-containing protein [Acidimicrobiales bacterium]